MRGLGQGVAGAVFKIATHAIIGGAVSMAQGGDFATGALTGAVSAGSSLLMDGSGLMGHSGDGDPGFTAARIAVAAVAGGTTSVLSGGKFANGAPSQAHSRRCIMGRICLILRAIGKNHTTKDIVPFDAQA